jgi:hypothetical protein
MVHPGNADSQARMSHMGDTSPGSLLFIYATDSGVFHALARIAYRIFVPAGYPCDLHRLTHGHLRAKPGWRRFIAELGVPCRLLHRDQVAGIPGVDSQILPAVYRNNGSGWVMCLSPHAIRRCMDLTQLEARIQGHCIVD